MEYGISEKLRIDLMKPLVEVAATIARYDEMLKHSPIGSGFVKRLHFTAAASSSYLQGDLVHLEDLVLHDGEADILVPNQEMATAYSMLRTRRLIERNDRSWPFSEQGASALAGRAVKFDGSNIFDNADNEFADIDALLERTNKLLNDEAVTDRPKRLERLIKADDDEERWSQWIKIFDQTAEEVPILRSLLLLDAWRFIEVSPTKPWLGYEYTNIIMRNDLELEYLPAVSIGLRMMNRNDRNSPELKTRLRAGLKALSLMVESATKDHKRLLARYNILKSGLKRKRQNSMMVNFIEYVMREPFITAPKAARDLGLSVPAILTMIKHSHIRELTNRRRYRVWSLT